MIYFLDTNIIVIYLRDGEIKERIDKLYSPLENRFSTSISIVTMGEIRSLAIRNSWGQKRLANLDELLKDILVVDINAEDIIQRYAEIDAFSQRKHPERHLNLSPRNMGKMIFGLRLRLP